MQPPSITCEKFGTLPNGDQINQFTLTQTNGTEFKILDYGLTFISLKMKSEKLNQFVDVLLGSNSLNFYLNQKFYMNGIIGRYANRVYAEDLILNDKKINLTANMPPFHIHGGEKGFDKCIWTTAAHSIVNNVPTLLATLVSPDGDQGYPGNLNVQIKIQLLETGKLSLSISANSDRDTWINITHHAYFNLSGKGMNLQDDHLFTIFSNKVTDIDKQGRTTNNILQTNQTALDFSNPKSLAAAINQGHPSFDTTLAVDHNYIFKTENSSDINKMAEAYSQHSGIRMQLSGSQPGMQFYTGNHLKRTRYDDDKPVVPYSGFCFEPQHFPDSPHNNEFPSCLLKVGDTYQQTIEYQFLQ